MAKKRRGTRALGEVRTHKPHQQKSRRVNRTRRVTLQAAIVRRPGQGYVAEVCIGHKPRFFTSESDGASYAAFARNRNARTACGVGRAATPTRALKKALFQLARRRK